jgi:hypothetical protein
MKTLTSKPLDVDGLQVEIVWDEFITGSSFFIPCINERSLMTSVLAQARKFKMRITYKARIENGMWGVRFWRVA